MRKLALTITVLLAPAILLAQPATGAPAAPDPVATAFANAGLGVDDYEEAVAVGRAAVEDYILYKMRKASRKKTIYSTIALGTVVTAGGLLAIGESLDDDNYRVSAAIGFFASGTAAAASVVAGVNLDEWSLKMTEYLLRRSGTALRLAPRAIELSCRF